MQRTNAVALARVVGGRLVVEECPQSIRECEVLTKNPHPVLVAYLVYVGKMRVVGPDGRELGLKELVEMFGGKSFWIVFSTYLDLRRKGRVPKPGALDNELILERDRLCIYIYEENAPVEPQSLIRIVESSTRRDCTPVIAVVDMYGDVTYYEVSRMSFPRIERR